MDIASLSLDSLLIIFDHVFYQTLLSSVPLVCAQWNQLQPVAHAKRRSLDLYLFKDSQFAQVFDIERNISKDWTKIIDVLHPKTFNLAYARALVHNFPAITKLFIYNNLTIDTSEEVLYLLEQWGPKLVCFDLSVKEDIQGSVERLIPALNSMLRLQKLNLHMPADSPKIDMPVLGRLVEIKLSFDSFDDGIVSQILKHCSTDRARHLSIGQVTHFASLAPLLLNGQISSQIRHLKVFDFDSTQLAAIFERCHSIRSFRMALRIDHFAERLCILANQSSLQELTLLIDEFNSPTPAASINLPVLGIVELWLYARLITHSKFVQITQLDRVFPQLRVVYFIKIGFGCLECEKSDFSEERCIGSLLQPLARIAGLEALNFRYIFETETIDLLPQLRKASTNTESAKECQKDAD